MKLSSTPAYESTASLVPGSRFKKGRNPVLELLAFATIGVGSVLSPSQGSAQEKDGKQGTVSVEKVTNERTYADLIEELEQLIVVVDGNDFKLREETKRKIIAKCVAILPRCNPLPKEIEEFFNSIPLVGADGKPNPEVAHLAYELREIRKAIKEAEEALPDTVPPGKYTIGDCVKCIQEITGFMVQIDTSLLKDADIMLEVREGENFWPKVLEQIRDTLTGEVQFTTNHEEILIVPKAVDHESRIFLSGKVIGLIVKDKNNPEKKIGKLRYPPRSGVITAVNSAQTGDSALHVLEIAQPTILQSDIYNGGSYPPLSVTPEFDDSLGSEGISFNCTIGTNSQSLSLVCENDQKGSIGMQEFSIDIDERLPLEVVIHVKWPLESDFEEDFEARYGLVRANRYSFQRDEKDVIPTSIKHNVLSKRT